jgi:transmembrane sensor
MKNIYPPFEEIQLLNYLLGKAGEEERRVIEEWLDSNESHRSYLDQLEKVWVEAGKIKPVPVAVDVNTAWEKMLSRISDEEKETPVRSLRYVWTVAAILLISFGLYFAAKMFLIPPKQIELTSTTVVVKDTLPDGSRVSLNSHTKLIYPEKFSRKKREVKLTGEAFFEVLHDAERPFIIEAGKAMIKVLGTSFNVKAYTGTDIEVSVKEGMVMLFTVNPAASDTLSVMLPAGTRGILPVNSMQPKIVEEEVPDRLFWLDRTLEFRQTELSEVFALLSSHFGIVIRTERPEILNCRLSATFRDESLETILEVIATSFELGVKNEGTNWLFYGKGCGK